MRDLWAIYDRLIEAVPAELAASGCLCGQHWYAVRSAGVGIAMAPGPNANLPGAGSYAARPARDLACLAKSWNFHEAALGMAAINSSINAPERVAAAFGKPLSAMPGANLFELCRDDVRGKKVTVIGHFPDIGPWREFCDLTILERRPQDGDTPDPACEWILPTQDIVISTAVTLINKTLPRLLELSKGARFILVGPTVPLSPLLFAFGIDTLAGLVIENQDQAWTTISEGGQHRLFKSGSRMVSIRREAACSG